MIDGQRCALFAKGYALPGYDAQKMSDLNAMRDGRRMVFGLPANQQNEQILGNPSDTHARRKFNEGLHRGVFSDHGVRLFGGVVRLLEIRTDEVVLELREGGAEWVEKAVETRLEDLPVAFDSILNAETIARSWEQPVPVVFLPVHRDEYPAENSSTDLKPTLRMMSTDDYLPFLHIASLIDALFAKAGYRIRSRFLSSPFFRALFMSGDYGARENHTAFDRMGFFARRIAECTATADPAGKVYADPKMPASTLGNLVETATAGAVDERGKVIPDLRNNGNSFGSVNGSIAFTPSVDIVAQFEFRLRFTTEHRILSRHRLTGFDTVYTGWGSELKFDLPNRYEDRREEPESNRRYRAVVFDHKSGARYRIGYHNSLSGNVMGEEFAERTSLFTTPLKGVTDSLTLYTAVGNSWQEYAGDWALYDGHIEERGTTTIDLGFRTSSELLRARTPCYFNRFFFAGAEEGMRLTLHRETSLGVRFTQCPGYGSRLKFSDVARGEIRGIVLLEALQHLFNLRFKTLSDAHIVEIEPYGDFYAEGPEVDWRNRHVLGEKVSRKDLALEMHRTTELKYRRGVGVVERFNALQSSPLGSWSYTAASFATKLGVEQRENPLFRPSLSSKGHFLNARSAYAIEIGDRDIGEEKDNTPSARIVIYSGLRSLPAGEFWSYPARSDRYPLAGFHIAEEHLSLTMEERGGEAGLNRFHLLDLQDHASGEEITQTISISPAEFAQLGTDNPHSAHLSRVYRIATDRGDALAHLHSTADYNPERHTLRCTFHRISHD